MPKIITLPELATIIANAAASPEDDDQAVRLTAQLSELCIEEFGGDLPGRLDFTSFVESAEGGQTCAVAVTFCNDVPDDGGVWKDFDTDVTVEEWKAERQA